MAKLKLRFDLIDLLHRVEDDRSKRIALTPILRQDSFKKEFGLRAIDKILERTNDGLDKKSRPFKKYSKAYKESLAFKVYGKTDLVNLKLSGEMQASIDVITTDKTGVTIGFVDPLQEDKAQGHVDGSGNLPVRDFWGLPDNDQEDIMNEIVRSVNQNDLEAGLVLLDQASGLTGVVGSVGRQDLAIGLFEEDL